MLLGLRTVVYKVSDLDRAKAWYAETFDAAPYFDMPFYVGFNIGGFELGLDPDVAKQPPGPGGSVAYWGVRDLKAFVAILGTRGIALKSPIQDVGEGILVASIEDPFGNTIGLIENPHFGEAAPS
jgi:predicted enzyme related to lactoylglutathione lyase